MLLFSYRCIKFVYRYLLPASFRYPLARGIARGICLFNASRRRVIVGNLTPLVGPDRARRMAPVLMGNFIMTAVDFFCARPERPRELAFGNWSRVEAAYQN